MEEGKEQSFCSTEKSCCGGKKLLVGIIAAILLFSAGFGAAKMVNCPKMCPVMQAK